MSSLGYLGRQPRSAAAGAEPAPGSEPAPGGEPAGPAAATLSAVTVRTATLVRCIGIGYVAAQVAIWHDFFAADAWRLTGPLAAVACTAGVLAGLHRGRAGWPLASLDSGAHLVLALTAGWCVPAAMRGDTANWLYIAMAVQLVMPAWFAPAPLTALLALASAAAYWGGDLLTRPAGGTSPAAAGALLLAVAGMLWWARHALARRAVRADAALAQADREAREQYVVLTRSAERREHERLLHDTVLNTLTALARPGGAGTADLIGRCWHDVTLVEHMLSTAGDEDEQAASQPLGGLLIGIEAVASEMRSRGLDVHVTVAPPAAPLSGGGLAVPGPVAAAAAHAVREALVNVLSHAGTSQAWVEVAATGAAGLQVTVRDAGVGFDPARVGPAHLGVRRSIVERVADSGGAASVRSAPGEGTVVCLCWTTVVPGGAAAGTATAPGDGPAQRGLLC